VFLVFQPWTWPLEMAGVPEFVRAPEMDWDQDYGYLTVYLAALYLLQNRRDARFRAVACAVLFLLAFAALTKHTTFVLALCAAGAVVMQNGVRKQWGAAVISGSLFVLFLAAHWLMAGQALANLPDFVRG